MWKHDGEPGVSRISLEHLIEGRKNWNSYLLRYGRCVAFYDWWEQDAEHSAQFLYQAAHLERVMWRKQRMASRAATSCQLKRFRFRHKRQAVLTSLEARWETTIQRQFCPEGKKR